MKMKVIEVDINGNVRYIRNASMWGDPPTQDITLAKHYDDERELQSDLTTLVVPNQEYWAKSGLRVDRISVVEFEIQEVSRTFIRGIPPGVNIDSPRVVECPDEYDTEGQLSVFLAGGISGCPNWQAKAIELFKDTRVVLFNPRRADFDISNTEMSNAQIEWESEYLNKVSAKLFWFPAETLCPITLFELGAAAHNNNQTLFVGCDPKYARSFDVRKQLALINPSIKVVHSLPDLVDQVRTWVDNTHRRAARFKQA